MARNKELRQAKNKEGIRVHVAQARAMLRGEWISDELHTALTRLDPAVADKIVRIIERAKATGLTPNQIQMRR
jgi:ABC-type arginine transport system ATPase subunit